MDVRVTPIDRLLTIHKSAVISIFLHFVHGRYRTARSWDWEWVEMVKWNGSFRSDRFNREKWSTSKGGLIFSKLFRLDRTDPFSFRPKFPEILVEWIAPLVSILANFFTNFFVLVNPCLTCEPLHGTHVMITVNQSKHALYSRDLFAWHKI